MITTEVEYGSSHNATISLGSDVDTDDGEYEIYITVEHEWGAEILAETRATRDSEGEYSYSLGINLLDSCGVYEITWRYVISGITYYQYRSIEVIKRYIDSTTFFAEYPEFEYLYSSSFDKLETKARQLIDTYCGQSFQYYSGLSKTYIGDDSTSLDLDMRIEDLTICTVAGIAITTSVRIASESQFYIEVIPTTDTEVEVESPFPYRYKFTADRDVVVTGNWGWKYIPTNVTRAAALLIESLINLGSDAWRYGLDQMWMDIQRFEFIEDKPYTGDQFVDTLLADYINLEFDYVA